MKATGVVRRIDDLGRIVVPKEIRKTMRIKEGEKLEIFTDSDSIILKKYSALGKINDYASDITESIYNMLKKNVFITDTDTIISISGPLKKKYINKKISYELINYIKKRESKIEYEISNLEIIDGIYEKGSYIISPINSNGDINGLIVILSDEEEIKEIDEKIIKVISNFLSKQIED